MCLGIKEALYCWVVCEVWEGRGRGFDVYAILIPWCGAVSMDVVGLLCVGRGMNKKFIACLPDARVSNECAVKILLSSCS